MNSIIYYWNIISPYVLQIKGILILLYISVHIAILYFLEHSIEKLHKEKDNEISSKSGQGRGIPLEIIKGQQNLIVEKYNNKIEKLERKRRFILDKLPMFKS